MYPLASIAVVLHVCCMNQILVDPAQPSNKDSVVINKKATPLGVDNDVRSLGPVSYYTEQFTGDFDLAWKSMTFTPDQDNGYTVCIEPITELPTNDIFMGYVSGADWCINVSRNPPESVWLFGQPYNQLWFTSSGQVLFESSFWCNENIDRHFGSAAISTLFDNLSPFSDTANGAWYYGSSLSEEKVAIKWSNYVQDGTNDPNTFSCELFFDGRIRLAWLDIGSISNIVGLSDGNGTPSDFVEDDFSESDSCGIPGDVNGDGMVGASDILLILAYWGDCSGGCSGDLNSDGSVDVLDLLIVIENWG